MRFLKLFLITTIMLVGEVFSSNDDKIDLKWNPNQGDIFIQELKHEMDMTMSSHTPEITGKMESHTHLVTQFGTTISVTEVINKDEFALITDFDYITFSSFRNNTFGMVPIELRYDSRQDNADTPLSLRNSFDKFFKIRQINQLNSKGKILDVRYVLKNQDLEIKSIEEAEILAAFQMINSKNSNFVYPNHPIAIGESWTQTKPSDSSNTITTYTLTDRSNGIFTINAKSQTVISFKSDKTTTIGFGNGLGEIKLDEKKGTILSSHFESNIQAETREINKEYIQKTSCRTIADLVTK